MREFLLSSSGSVVRNTLRGVAWPEPKRAHAVGDSGAMWQWREENRLWERDPGAPIGFEGNLMDAAFDPFDPERGYAVGKAGTLLRYGKSWTQEALPGGFEGANFSQIAFAGREALVATENGLLTNDGSGWRVDAGAHALLRSTDATGRLFAVAGLPDGGAVAAGEHRDRARRGGRAVALRRSAAAGLDRDRGRRAARVGTRASRRVGRAGRALPDR